MWSSRRPSSERAVTSVSSSRGWRSTIAAVSAPANPAAPSTATLCTQGPADFLDSSLDRAACAGHVLVAQRPLGRPELQTERQRLPSLTHLSTAVDVEQLDPFEKLTATRPNSRLHLPSRQFLVHHDGQVLIESREGGDIPVRRGPRSQLGDQLGVELEPRDRPVEIPRPRHGRVELADPAQLALVAGEHGRGTAGMEERPLTRL